MNIYKQPMTLWKDRDPLELNSAWTSWIDRGECFECGNDHVEMRVVSNARNPGHRNDNPHTRESKFWKFRCKGCGYIWMNMPESIDG